MSTTGPPPLRVAIFGGGIGAIALTVGLLSYPHIDVHVYEAKASFSETSAAVGLGTNALKALELIDKEGHARAAVDKAGMTRYSPTARMIMVSLIHTAKSESEDVKVIFVCEHASVPKKFQFKISSHFSIPCKTALIKFSPRAKALTLVNTSSTSTPPALPKPVSLALVYSPH